MNKYQLIDKVAMSTLTNTQKQLLTFLILKGDSEGVSWHPVSTLCKVAGITHEKNFKGVGYYLPDLVTIEKVVTKNGKNNRYTVCTPAVEGLVEAQVFLKETVRRRGTPSVEGADKATTPADEGDPTPAQEGTCTPSAEGTNSTSNTTDEYYKRKTEASQAQPPFESNQETKKMSRTEKIKVDGDLLLFGLDPAAPGLSKKELEEVYDLTNDKPWGRLSLEEAVTRVFNERGKGWLDW